MKSFWCTLVMISLLCMSVDGIADSVVRGHPHSDAASQQMDIAETVNADKTSDVVADEEHCERCCHGHSSSITAKFVSPGTTLVSSEHTAGGSTLVRNFGTAPPTPPPTA